ncbi:shikimate dehydrogenase [Actinoplanes sp. NPDC051851]|uniref:shikimate dehydrogenase n=1 Tax=Actinoplanes sp. NPDC051851 TaxID=3154753 RepID=UPI0034312298
MDGFLIGLIGAGIQTSLSPALHEAEATHLGLRYFYQLIDVAGSNHDTGELLRAARLLGFRGLNITHPGKQRVLEHLDELSPGAAAIGAVNTVLFEDGRAIGHNTDGHGFTESLRRGLPHAPISSVVQLGAGGAGAAVAFSIVRRGAPRLTIVDVDESRAARLAHRAGAESAPPARLPDLLATADGLVNTTPVGMEGTPGLPLDPALLHPGLWVADIVYRPLETALLRAAREAGCATLDGGGMVVHQAAEAFRLFTGRTPEIARMTRHFAELTARAGSHA